MTYVHHAIWAPWAPRIGLISYLVSTELKVSRDRVARNVLDKSSAFLRVPASKKTVWKQWHILVTAGNVCISCITADTLLMLSLGILRSLGTLGSLPVVCYKFTRDTWVTSFTLWPSRHTWDLGVTWSEHWGACGGHLIHSVTWGTSLWGTGTGAIHLLTGDTFVTCTLGPSHLGHLGHCPEAGSVARLGVERNLELAKEWTEQAAKRGHKKAIRSKGIKVFGVGPWLDYDPDEMGVERIVKEAEAGNTHAQFRLGSMYYEGEKMSTDKAKASYWFMQAAQAGLPEAQYQISRMLFLGDGVEADTEYAMRFLKLAAGRGHVESMHNLGAKLYFGDGIENDRRTAASWFLKAAQEGFPQSQNNLGWMLYTGDGVPMNTQEGLKWLEKAANAGNEEAQYHLLAVRGTMISG
ncbi:esiB [Symbiodinium natans]|uniref:EsiB protein n=1 Tax=Symbiodinium natans TaxID=878477 RepID=A0A812RX45_9DINO|nr:esiB [Symbiodinium natans]